MDAYRWELSDSREYCTLCISSHQAEGIPCECEGCEHERPSLLPENRLAWHLWKRLQTQRIYAGMTGALVGVDYRALEQVGRICDIDIDECMLSKIQALEAVMIKEVNRRVQKSGDTD